MTYINKLSFLYFVDALDLKYFIHYVVPCTATCCIFHDFIQEHIESNTIPS